MKTKVILGSLLALSVGAIGQNLFPTPSGIVHVNSSGIITNAQNKLEIHSSTGSQVGIGGLAPVINFYGGTSVPNPIPGAFTSPYCKLALATAPMHYVSTAVAGDMIFQNMATSSMPLAAGTDGKSILFSSHFDSGNGVEHMRINEEGHVGIGTHPLGAGALRKTQLRVLNFDALGQGTDERFGIFSHIEPITDMCSDCYHAHEIGVGGEAISNYQGKYLMKGVLGRASEGLDNWGGYFTASGGIDTWVGAGNIGVHAKATGNWNAYGVYAEASGAFANQFAVWSNGWSYATGSWLSSDRKLKQDIEPLNNSMDKIMMLKPSTYNFKTDEFKTMNLPEGKQVGLIAQELETVFPEMVMQISKLVIPDEKGNNVEKNPDFKAVNYVALIPVLIAGIQEQQKTIEAQQKQLDDQKQLIDGLTQKASSTTGINTVNTIETGFQMSQNEPNPFTHETVVKYTLPTTISNAFMAVYDLTGKQITTFPINERGSASVVLTSDKLSAGIYIYSIVADGKVVDSKRMIVAEK